MNHRGMYRVRRVSSFSKNWIINLFILTIIDDFDRKIDSTAALTGTARQKPVHRGVPGTCHKREFSFLKNNVCHTPRLYLVLAAGDIFQIN